MVGDPKARREADAKALADKVAAKKALETSTGGVATTESTVAKGASGVKKK